MSDNNYDWGEGAFYSDEENKNAHDNNNIDPNDEFQESIEYWDDMQYVVDEDV